MWRDFEAYCCLQRPRHWHSYELFVSTILEQGLGGTGELLHLSKDRGGEVDDGVDAAELLQQEYGAADLHALVAEQLTHAYGLFSCTAALHICIQSQQTFCMQLQVLHSRNITLPWELNSAHVDYP